MAANRNKNAGNAYELLTIKFFSKWFKGLVSSRSESRNLDNAGIDIAETEDKMPFYIQCKNSVNNPNYHKLITTVKRTDRPLLVFHKKTEKRGKTFRKVGEYVTMDLNTFEMLMDKIYDRTESTINKEMPKLQD